MVEVKNVEVLNFDDKSYSVTDCSKEIQDLVGYFNVINKREAELIDNYQRELYLVQASKEALLIRLNVQFRKDQEAAKEKTEEPQLLPVDG